MPKRTKSAVASALGKPRRAPVDVSALSPLERQELFQELLAGANWCRARLLIALAGAARQGILDEVLDELLPSGVEGGSETEDVLDELIAGLKEGGWLRAEDRA